MKLSRFYLCIYVAISFFAAPIFAQTPRAPRLAVVGDSISTGLFADTTLGHYPDRLEEVAFSELSYSDYYNIITQLDSDQPLDFSMILRGDKLMRVLDKSVNPDLAVLTTGQPWGLRAAIADLHGFTSANDIPVVSVARNGARYTTMALEQVEQLPDDSFEYVAMMLGGNDVSNLVGELEFTRAFDKAFMTLLRKQSRATIILPLIPLITQLRDIALPPLHIYREVNLGFFGGTRVVNFETDIFSRLRTQTCPGVFMNDPEIALHLIERFNEHIQTRVEAANQKAISQGGRPRVVLVRETVDLTVDADFLAVDGFHPNWKGQKVLGQVMQQVFKDAMLRDMAQSKN